MVQGRARWIVLGCVLSACGCVLSACGEDKVAEAKQRVAPEPPPIRVRARVVTPDGLRVLAAPAPTTRPRVDRLDVRVGQRISEGDPIATFEGLTEAKLDIEIAKSELQRAEVAVEWAARPFRTNGDREPDPRSGKVAEATADRRRLRTIAEERRIAVRRAELRAQRLRLRAPASGRILAIHAQPGESVDPDEGVVTLLPNDRAVHAVLDRTLLSEIRVGTAVTFECNDLEKPLTGRITRIDEHQNPEDSEVPIFASFEGSFLLSHLGATGRLRIERPKSDRTNSKPDQTKR